MSKNTAEKNTNYSVVLQLLKTAFDDTEKALPLFASWTPMVVHVDTITLALVALESIHAYREAFDRIDTKASSDKKWLIVIETPRYRDMMRRVRENAELFDAFICLHIAEFGAKEFPMTSDGYVRWKQIIQFLPYGDVIVFKTMQRAADVDMLKIRGDWKDQTTLEIIWQDVTKLYSLVDAAARSASGD